ncbi:Ig-like domain-containing protein [Levilactobacillus tangyuanensis]|uniref:Ig-like domain-containing protein n=1 Tax=Levilactobacillus tangyuanensis TaxID=2486021 RepID=A0ABW1TQX9_9LACO|nr:Ig-like domain-containing protein [Levilactobacillus tangyuanensis]
MKKFMIALTGLVTLATVGAVVPATAVTSATTAHAATHVGPSLSVNAIRTSTTKVSGTATKSSKITVKATKNAKKNLASGTASKKTGKFSVKLSKKLKKNANVYVYATNPKTKTSFYRIIRVEGAATKAATTTKKTTTKKTTTKKATTKKTTAKKSTANFTVKTPTGTWKSNTANKYSQKWVFSQKTGLNEYLYKNGKKVKTLVSYAKYSVSAKTPTFWKITYTPKGSKTKKTVYLRFTSAKKFKIVNSKNKVVAVKAGVAPAAKWTFTK